VTAPVESCRSCLLIAYYYPPGGGVGVQRALKFSKYLPEFGWRPVVLTAESPLGIPPDPSLVVPDHVALYRAAPTVAFASGAAGSRALLSRMMSAAILVPDPFIGWLPAAFQRGMQAIRTERPDVIVATSPPNSSQLLGWALAWRSGLPLVADFRDAWLTDPDRNRALHHRMRAATVEKLMEALVIRRASRVISVSEAILDDFRARYPGVPADTFTVIENGFDDDDFTLTQPMDLGAFPVVLTGSMDKPNRAAAPLLHGVAELLRTTPQLRASLRVHLVGPDSGSDRELVERLGLASVVRFAGWVSHATALSYQRSAAVNVMVWAGPDDERSSQMMSSKLFEYIGSRRPILAAVSASSAAARMLARVATARVVAPADVAGIAAELGRLAEQTHARSLAGVDLEPFTRRYQAGQLAAVLSAVAAP
jgi:glycosyltransferase involved in cell wall biosynthesis